MAVRIRLRRTGARNSGAFRIVAADSAAPRDGRFIEVLGWYDPQREGTNFSLNLDRLNIWKAEGAHISDTVASLMKKARNAKPVEEAAAAPEPEAKADAEETEEAKAE